METSRSKRVIGFNDHGTLVRRSASHDMNVTKPTIQDSVLFPSNTSPVGSCSTVQVARKRRSRCAPVGHSFFVWLPITRRYRQPLPSRIWRWHRRLVTALSQLCKTSTAMSSSRNYGSSNQQSRALNMGALSTDESERYARNPRPIAG